VSFVYIRCQTCGLHYEPPMKKENFSLSDNCDFDVLTIYHQILVYTIREKNPKGNFFTRITLSEPFEVIQI